MEQEALRDLGTQHKNVVCHWYKGYEPQSKLMHTTHGDKK